MAIALSHLRRRRSVSFPAAAVAIRMLSNSSVAAAADDPKPPSNTYDNQRRFLRHASVEVSSNVDHSPFLGLPPTRVTALPGGIRVVSQRFPAATRMASVGVWIDAGSRYEAPGTNGAAHFLEHIIFKGTRRRSVQSLEVEVENMGAHLNAYTSREQTTFFADAMEADVPKALDILSDILQNSLFSEQAINKERGVILREMQEVQGQMEEVIFDHLHEAAFRGHPLGNTILGPEENIRSITRDDLVKYISSHYTCPRMVVSAAGAVEHEQVVDLVSRWFCKFSTDSTTAEQLTKANPAIFTGTEIHVEDKEMPEAHVAIAFKGASWIEPNSVPLMVMQTMLSSWNRSCGVGSCSGSELARRISIDGLAESMMSFNTNYNDIGLFGVYCTAAPDCLRDLSSVIMEEFRRLASQVSELETQRAKNQLKSGLLLHADNSTAVAENNGRQMLTYGRVMPFAELFARIEAVDSATIMETAKEFVINKDIAIAAMGPLHKLPDLRWFRAQTTDGKA